MNLAKYTVVLLFLISCANELEHTKKEVFFNKEINIPDYFETYDPYQYRHKNNIKCLGSTVNKEDLNFINKENNCFLEFQPRRTYGFDKSNKEEINRNFENLAEIWDVPLSDFKWIDKQVFFKEKYVKIKYESSVEDYYYHSIKYLFNDFFVKIDFRCDIKLKTNIKDFNKLVDRIEKDNFLEELTPVFVEKRGYSNPFE